MKYSKLFLIISISIYSCGLSEVEARKKCHINQVGKYLYNASNDALRQKSNDSTHFAGLVIIFQPDSTFHTNRSVPFIEDTVGLWDAGTCGFESSGKLQFKNTPVVIDFSPYNENDSMFAIIGPKGEDGRSQYYWFKKQSKMKA
ncbi:hypothetical protein QFZ51_004656 [Chitinophaga sp. W3I9]|uniref:hypothetical protein n=1 Tax=Chitinophaga sp. W3I9 TaxID=3373924 RepID=UPI003D1969E6